MGPDTPPTRATTITLAAIAVVSSCGLIGWLNNPLFRDEAASLYSAHVGLAALWRQSQVSDLVLLPYYVFLHLWMEVAGSVAWARLPSLLAYGLTVFLVGRLGTRLGGPLSGIVAAVVAASNPLMIQAALDARPYALTALTCTGAAIALLRWLDSGGTQWAWWFCLASLATLLLQVFAVLGPVFIFGVAAVIRPQRFRAQARQAIAPIGVLLAGVVAFVVLVTPQRGQIAWIPFSHALSSVVYSFAGPVYAVETPYARLVLVAVVAGIALCVVAWRRSGTRPTRPDINHFAVSLGWAFLPTFLLVAVSFVKPVYLERYVTESAPGFAIAIGLLLSRAFHLTTASWRTRSRRATGGLLVGLGAALVILTCSTPTAKHVQENEQEEAAYLASHVGDDGAVALPDHALTTAIEYYARGSHERLRVWPEVATQPQIDGIDLRIDPAAFANAPNNVWLLIDATHPRTAAFTGALERHGYSLVVTTKFRGWHTEHYRRKTR